MRDDPDMPNAMPLESENTSVPVDTDCVPAETPKGVSAGKLALAVTRELPDIPNVTLLLLLKTSVPVDTLCVPALTPNGVSVGTV